MRAFLVPILITLSVTAATAADRGRPGVPLNIDPRGGIVVNVRVNGTGPFRFVLDTGAARTVVADDLARELAAPVVAKSEIVTSAGSDMRLVVQLASLSIDAVKQDDVLAAVVPVVRLAQLGPGVRGLLGQDFLSAFNYTLDYRRARLTWDDALSCAAPGASRLVEAEGRFLLPLEDDDGAPLRLVPDSGAEVPVLFRARAGDTAGAAALMVGLGPGERQAHVTTVRRLRVGSVTMRDLAAYVIERPDAGADGVLPLHGFASVSFAAGGACLVVRR